MGVRGAPAIGVSAAYGVALGALHTAAATPQKFASEFERICAGWRGRGLPMLAAVEGALTVSPA